MEKKKESWLARSLGVFRYTRRAVELVWGTSRTLTVIFAALTLVAGLLPAGMAVVGKQIIDGVLLASETGALADRNAALLWVAVEGLLVVANPTLCLQIHYTA